MWAYTTVQKTDMKQNSKHKPKFQGVKTKKAERSYKKNECI